MEYGLAAGIVHIICDKRVSASLWILQHILTWALLCFISLWEKHKHKRLFWSWKGARVGNSTPKPASSNYLSRHSLQIYNLLTVSIKQDVSCNLIIRWPRLKQIYADDSTITMLMNMKLLENHVGLMTLTMLWIQYGTLGVMSHY